MNNVYSIFVISICIIAISNTYCYAEDSLRTKVHTLFQIVDTTSECTIITKSRSSYKNIVIIELRDSFVFINKDDITRKLLVNDVRTIKFNARGFWKGARLGGGIGFGLGFILGANISSKFNFGNGFLGGMLFAIPLGLLGGGIVVLIAEDELYDLGNLNLNAKKSKIKYLIKKYSE